MAKSPSSCSDHPGGRRGANPLGPLPQSSTPPAPHLVEGVFRIPTHALPAWVTWTLSVALMSFHFNKAASFSPRLGPSPRLCNTHFQNAANFSVWFPDPDVKTTTFHLRFVAQKAFNIGDREPGRWVHIAQQHCCNLTLPHPIKAFSPLRRYFHTNVPFI